MNTAPPPVNLNALAGILGKSKKVMQQTDATNPITLSERTQKERTIDIPAQAPPATGENGAPAPQPLAGPQAYNEEQVRASNLPPMIKEAMIKTPIAPPTMASTSFQLEDMSELEDVKMTPNKRPTINENIVGGSDMMTISKSELKNMINESVIDILSNNYAKNISEAAIKKTINLLIKEGKINVKKKKV